MTAYRTETLLCQLIAPTYARHHEEVRRLVKTIATLPGDLLPDPSTGRLHVRLYGLANARSQAALLSLCQTMNTRQACYPGTNWVLVFEAVQSH